MTAKLTWRAEDVLRAVHGHCLHEQTWEAYGVSINTRAELKSGDLFVALEGPKHDGHDYVGAAFAAGASAAIVSRQAPQIPADAPLIYVEDTFSALEFLGIAGRARSKASILAVTGSVGKTTTKEMLRQTLHAVGMTYANEGSLNNHWGVPLSLARLPSEARYGVFEMGMNHAGELANLSRLVRPDIALITTIEAVHMEFFSSIEDIADAKAEIFYGMKPDGVAILNRDNNQYSRLYALAKAQGLKKILDFGYHAKASGRLVDYSPSEEGAIIKAEILGKKIEYRLSVHGEHLALNSLGALLASVAAGGDLETCADALHHFQQPAGRGVLETLSTENGSLTLIDESYNASPVSVIAAIRVLGQLAKSQSARSLLILGDMKELGSASPSLHKELQKDIAESDISQVFCCGEMMAHLYEALPLAQRGALARDSRELSPLVTRAIKSGDIITIKGSHSMQMEHIVDALRAMSKDKTATKLAV